MPTLRFVFLGSILILVAAVIPARADEPALKGLDDYIAKSMKEWDVPGLAIAVVKNDQIILSRGYGARKLGESAPVDEKTVFAIASCSKAFTAAALAILVDEGKLKWDDPVVKYLPWFQMQDPAVTREVTVRDLLCHRCGLARHDQVWYDSGADRDEILRRLRFAKPTWSFRSQFGYQNIMYLCAGQIVQAVSGKRWDEFVTERIFTPLGMASSSTSVKALDKLGNVATPHAKIDEKVQTIPWRNIDNAGPAGSINSNVADMANWLRLQLNGGTFGKMRIVSAGSIAEMHSPQMLVRTKGMGPEGERWDIMFTDAQFPSYGLGWMTRDFRGKKATMHGGSIDGMNSWVALVPEEKIGVVVLTNFNPNMAMSALCYRVLDAFLGAPPRDWSAEFRKKAQALEDKQKEAEKKEEKERVADTKPSLALAKYAGTYHDDLYGDIKIAFDKDALTYRQSDAYVGAMEHWHFDTFRIVWKDKRFGKALLTFTLNPNGNVEELKVPSLGTLVARRVKDKK